MPGAEAGMRGQDAEGQVTLGRTGLLAAAKPGKGGRDVTITPRKPIAGNRRATHPAR